MSEAENPDENEPEIDEGSDADTSWLDNSKVREILERDLDETDYRIYKALNENGRMSDTELGERVGLSRTAVRRRREKLEERGIMDVLAVLILQEAELAYADVRVRFSPEVSDREIREFVSGLQEEELIYEIDEYMGKYDLLVRVWHASLSDIKSYLREEFQTCCVIDSYETTPVTKTLKAWHKELDSLEGKAAANSDD